MKIDKSKIKVVKREFVSEHKAKYVKTEKKPLQRKESLTETGARLLNEVKNNKTPQFLQIAAFFGLVV